MGGKPWVRGAMTIQCTLCGGVHTDTNIHFETCKHCNGTCCNNPAPQRRRQMTTNDPAGLEDAAAHGIGRSAMTETQAPQQQPLDHDKLYVIRWGINLLAHEVHECAVGHGWWDDGLPGQTTGEKIALMHSELSEALECERNHEPVLWYSHGGAAENPTVDNVSVSETMPEYQGKLGKPEGMASEFADTIIRILDFCKKRDIPIAEALIAKHNFNLTRSHRHGDKAY